MGWNLNHQLVKMFNCLFVRFFHPNKKIQNSKCWIGSLDFPRPFFDGDVVRITRLVGTQQSSSNKKNVFWTPSPSHWANFMWPQKSWKRRVTTFFFFSQPLSSGSRKKITIPKKGDSIRRSVIGPIYIYNTMPLRQGIWEIVFCLGEPFGAKHFVGVKVEGGPRNSDVVGPDLSNHHLANPNGSSK